MQRRVALIFGTRPEAIKMAPVIRAFGADPGFQTTVVSTGQHDVMLDQVLGEFGIRPDVDLRVRAAGQTLAGLTGAVLGGVDGVLERHRPHAVLVHGDTTTTMGASLAAFYRKVPLVHVEAGLRSGNRWAPYPEEVNRRITTLVTDLHLAPTGRARRNLLDEGVDPAAVTITGNTVIDAMSAIGDLPVAWPAGPLRSLAHDDRRVLVVTMHRREMWGSAMTRVVRTIAAIADDHPEMLVVVCLHGNPAVQAALRPHLAGRSSVLTVPPQPYSVFLQLLRRAHLVVSDSGGVQEECSGLRVPVLVLREVTERQEGVGSGGLRLVGVSPKAVRAAIEQVWGDPAEHARMAAATNPYGDGRAAGRCVAAVARLLGLTEAAAPEPSTAELRTEGAP